MKSPLFFAAALMASAAEAQLPTVDITVVALGSDSLEVRLHPDHDFSGLVAEILFTLRWDAASDIHLGEPDQVSYGPPYCAIYTATASALGDGEIDNAGYRYQTYLGFGASPLLSGCVWTANVEVPYVRIPIIAPAVCSDLQIVNDAYTTTNNKNFYMSLNAIDATGSIYGPGAQNMGGCAGVDEMKADPSLFTLSPNPAAELVNINGREVLRAWRILDAEGRTVSNATRTDLSQFTVGIGALQPGAYVFVAFSASGSAWQRFVVVR